MPTLHQQRLPQGARPRPRTAPITPGKLFILSGPSQVGKDSIVRALWKMKNLKLTHVVTNTTRAKRPGEVDGVELNFLTEQKFQHLIDSGQLLEWAMVRGCHFGTPKRAVLDAITLGKNVILNIDVQGARQVQAKLPKAAVLIFINAESADEVQRRIFVSPKMSAEQKTYRWREAQRELAAIPRYRYVVVNRFGELKAAILEVKNIIKRETGA